MANFQRHLGYGAAVSFGCSLLGYWQFGLTPVQGAAACIVGTLASLAPDLDHPEGIPGRVLSEILIALTPILLFLHFSTRYDMKRLEVEHWIVIFCFAHLAVKHLSIFTLSKLTSHRGIFHSFPAAVICGQVVFLIFSHLALKERIVIAAIAMLGYLTHLIADEFYGVDWDKLRAKRSLGSAVDLGKINGLSTWIAYVLIAILGAIIWHQYSPGSEPIASIFNYLQG